LRLDQKDISARTLIQLKKLYNNRIKTGALPSYDAFVKPVLIGISRNDGLSFLNGVLDCARQLVKARPDTDAVRLLTRLARGYATWLELPLLNPNQDPYGLAADLQAAGQNPDATQACAKLLKLVELLKSFRKS
ncbi:MAG TPA: hypothetical protein PKM25_01245, partial [Candidatus Ozemobacteraceae bacterium]|nr:hypothetical protein [Candidatus Ozemobacteraceae bacterium]